MKDEKTWLFRALKQLVRIDGCTNSWDTEEVIDELIDALNDHIKERTEALLQEKLVATMKMEGNTNERPTS